MPQDPEPCGGAPVSDPAHVVASDAPGLETDAPVGQKKPGDEKGRSSERPAGSQAWRLTMIGQIRLKHLTYRTEQTYVEWISRFAGSFRRGGPGFVQKPKLETRNPRQTRKRKIQSCWWGETLVEP
ncbi:MAG: hypothetical protein HY735_08950 [Verrucomicrobia bacterium]|nr:hypothetical protein [Verrucomicrobiota bacterium]